MAALLNLFSRKARAAEPPLYTASVGALPGGNRAKDLYANSIGNLAQPGKRIARDELQRRRDSRIFEQLDGSTEYQADDADDRSFTHLGRKLRAAWNRWTAETIESLNTDIGRHFAPNACAYSVLSGRTRHVNSRSLCILIVAFLTVFGAFYSLVEYLLLATRASAACSTTTVYVPVTYTTTTTVTNTPSSSASLASALGGGSLSPMLTITSTSIMTNTITVVPATASLSALTSPGGPSYYYSMALGTTSWFNGVSPSGGESLTTGTTSIFVSPVATLPSTSNSTVTIHSTATDTETVTAPVYTTTVYSVVGPALTTTSTSTQYTTLSLFYVSPSSSRASRSSIQSSGWNASSSAVAAPSTPTVSGTSAVTTQTQVYYWGTGNATTSTSIRRLTTTVLVVGSTTVTPSSTSFDIVPTTSGSTLTTAPSSAPLASSVGTKTTADPAMPNKGSPYDPTVSVASTSVASAGLPNVTQSNVNATSVGAITGSSMSLLTPYGYPTVVPSLPTTLSASSTIVVSSNVSLSMVGPMTNSSSVNAVTATLATGSLTTVILETTTTTLGLIETLSSTMTVSGWFVYNGTTVIPDPTSDAPAATGGIVPSDPTDGVPTLSRTLSAYPYSGPAPFSMPSVTTTPSSSGNGSSTVGPLTSQISNTSTTAGSTVSSAVSPRPSSSLASASSDVSALTGSASSSSLTTSSVTVSSASSVASRTLSATSPSNSSFTRSNSPSAPSSQTSAASSSGTGGTLVSTTVSTLGPGSGSSSTASTGATQSSSSFVPSTTLTTASTSSLSSSSTGGSSGISSSTTGSVSASSTIMSATSGSSMTSSARATPTVCGEHGNFTATFDDLPNFTPTNSNQTDITQSPPVPHPYHHLTFSNGYVYAPSPREPFAPVSPPHVAAFLANASGMTTSAMKPGEIGDGIYETSSAFWFNATSAYLGCDNGGPENCTMVFNAYTWSPSSGAEILTYSQNATLPPCPNFSNCRLQQVSFPPSFTGLSGLQIRAFVGNEERMFFMDDLALGWYNNTCDAGLMRQRYQ